MGENVADLAGLTVAQDAYIASLGGKEPPVIDGLTGDQRFYLGWAQVWRRNYREANLRQRLLTDPHSPSEARATSCATWIPGTGIQSGAWPEALSFPCGSRAHLVGCAGAVPGAAPDRRHPRAGITRWLAPAIVAGAALSIGIVLLLFGLPLIAGGSLAAAAAVAGLAYLRGSRQPIAAEPLIVGPDYSLAGSALGIATSPRR